MGTYIQLTKSAKVSTETRVRGFMRLPAFDIYRVENIREVNQYYTGKNYLVVIKVDDELITLTEDCYRALTIKEAKYYNQEVYVTDDYLAKPIHFGEASLSMVTGQSVFIDGYMKNKDTFRWVPFFILGSNAYFIPFDKMELRAPIDEMIYQKKLPEELWNFKEQ